MGTAAGVPPAAVGRVGRAPADRRIANTVVEAAEQVARALRYLEQGLDFADGLHLAASPGAERFYTFDRRFLRCAVELGLTVVEPDGGA